MVALGDVRALMDEPALAAAHLKEALLELENLSGTRISLPSGYSALLFIVLT